MLKLLHVEIASLSIKTIVNFSPLLKLYSDYIWTFVEVIRLVLCREYEIPIGSKEKWEKK